MKSNNSPGKRLFEILELQMEILEISLKENDRTKYVRVRNTVSQFLQKLISIATEDFERFKRIIDLKNQEEEELFNDIKVKDKQLFNDITSSNKTIRFLIKFFLNGVLNAFQTSDEQKFRIFYTDLNNLFNEITSNKYVTHKSLTNLFGDEYRSPYLKTKFFLDESISAYFDFISIGEGFNTSVYTRQQALIKYTILFELHREYYFKDNFELTLTQETLNLIERIIIEQIIDKDDHTAFSWICSSLYSIADEKYYRKDELRVKASTEKQVVILSLIDEARSINTIDQFSAFDDKLNENQSIESFVKEIRQLAVFSVKYALFRYMFIRIGAYLISKERKEMTYQLLFARQPLEVDFVNNNHDFYPTEVEDVTEVLTNLDKLSYKNFGRFEKKPLNKQRDQFILLWLIRNYIWKEQHLGYKYDFGLIAPNQGPEVERLKKLLTKFIDLIYEWKDINSDWLTFQKRIPKEKVDAFEIEISKLKETVLDEHLRKIRDALFIEEEVNSFKTKVIATLNKQKSLTNFFLRNQGQYFELSENGLFEGNIRTIQLYDKGPFIDSSLPLNPSINADSVYPQVMGENLTIQSDSYLFRKIKRYCSEEYLTLRELSEKLLSSNFKDKTILSHYIHLGFELLRDEFDFNMGSGSHEGTFTTLDGSKTKVYSFYSYSQLKFVLVFNNSKMDQLIDVSRVEISQKDYPEDRLQVLFEGVFNLTIKDLKNEELGTIYYLR